VALLRRDPIPDVIRALRAELDGGPRALIPPELEVLGGLVHAREERARSPDEPVRELLAALPDAAALVDQVGKIRFANALFEALAPSGRATGLTPLEVTRSGELDEGVRRALEGTGRAVDVEIPGVRRAFRAQVAPLLRGEVLVLLHDVTEARRAAAARRDLVANASHELRTPVAAISAAAETLLGGALDDPAEARRFVEMVARHAERLTRLTRDLLDLSRIESGAWPMQLGRVELAPLARTVLELLAGKAASRRIDLRCEVPEGLAAVADPRALEQVLVNLVDNAVKHTPDGRAVAIRAEEGDGRVVLSVADEGPGIERHHLPRIFERFYRVDPGRARDQGGTGLGLAIVKHLVQAQHGEIGVESGSGGSRFWVRLPKS